MDVGAGAGYSRPGCDGGRRHGPWWSIPDQLAAGDDYQDATVFWWTLRDYSRPSPAGCGWVDYRAPPVVHCSASCACFHPGLIVILLEELLYECLPEQGLAISASASRSWCILSVPCQLVSCSSSCVPVPDDPFHLFLASLLFSLPLFISYGLGLCKYPIHTCPPSTRPPPLHPPAPSGLHRRSLHNLQLCLSSPATVPSIHHPSRAAST